MALLDAKIDEKAETLTLVLSLEKKPRPSTSGKSLIVATSGGGSVSSGQSIKGKDVQVSASAYIAK